MDIHYLFSAAGGDVVLDDATLERPFVVAPFETHPFLTLRDFFDAVRDFVLQGEGGPLRGLLERKWGRAVAREDLRQVAVRYEKYGTLYQIASVEILGAPGRLQLALTAALDGEARRALAAEFETLRQLRALAGRPYVPEVYWQGAFDLERGGRRAALAMMAGEWFEGFHEWHFAGDQGPAEKICIWNMQRGYEDATPAEAQSIIHEATAILADCYEWPAGRQITPWHHAAGDFVVQTGGGPPEVRLVTVRGYGPVDYPLETPQDPWERLLFFFLDTSVRMRLDREGGMGGDVWAGAWVLPAVIAGFRAGWERKWTKGRSAPSQRDWEAFQSRLGSLEPQMLQRELLALGRLYQRLEPRAAAFINRQLAVHARELADTLAGREV